MNTPQTIPEMLALYRRTVEDANINVSLLSDPYTRPGFENRRNGAIASLPNIRQELVRMVEQQSGAVFLLGPAKTVEEFVGIAEDETDGNVLVLSAGEMYQTMAQTVDQGIRTDRRFSMDCIAAFTAATVKLLNDIMVEGIPAPDMSQYLNRPLANVEAVAGIVREALTSVKAADGLNAIWLQKRTCDLAIERGIDANFIPVIVTGATDQEAEGELNAALFLGRNVSVTVHEAVSKDLVIAVFNKLKAKRRGIRQIRSGQ